MVTDLKYNDIVSSLSQVDTLSMQTLTGRPRQVCPGPGARTPDIGTWEELAATQLPWSGWWRYISCEMIPSYNTDTHLLKPTPKMTCVLVTTRRRPHHSRVCVGEKPEHFIRKQLISTLSGSDMDMKKLYRDIKINNLS